MKKLFLLLSFFTLTASAQTTAQLKPADEQQIKAVIETFRSAIMSKDKKAEFIKLFFGSDARMVPWIGVLSDASLANVRVKNPAAVKANGATNYLEFINGLTASKEHFEEKFSNIKIMTDGDIAAVHFDYSFHINERKTNWGQEAWQLVRQEDGWKINGVIYSIILDPPKP